MASAAERRRRHHLSCFLHFANLTSKPPSPFSKIHLPLLLPEFSLSVPFSFESTWFEQPPSAQSGTPQPTSSAPCTKNMHAHDSGFGFPSTVRISTGKGRGPDFVGQVFSICDLSGTGLMSVSTNIEIPFLSKRYQILTVKNDPFYVNINLFAYIFVFLCNFYLYYIIELPESIRYIFLKICQSYLNTSKTLMLNTKATIQALCIAGKYQSSRAFKDKLKDKI